MSDDRDLERRMAALSPEQRALLELRQRQRATAAPGLEPIRPRNPAARTRQSVDQERLWFMHQLEPDSAAYNVSVALRLRGPLDPPTMERCLHTLVQRHEILRTTYDLVDGQPAQRIASDSAVRLSHTDLREHDPATREQAARQRLVAAAQRPFDLRHGPVLRAELLALTPAEHLLLLTMHHIATDWWSFNLFCQELLQLYDAAQAGWSDPHAPPLEPLPIQFADFAQWQRDWLQQPAQQAHLAYWQARLGSESNPAPPQLDLPADRPRPALQTFRGAREEVTVPRELLGPLAALCQRAGVTPFMALLAAFDALLYRYTGQTDLVVGAPIANRRRAETERLIGFFVNTLVLRTDLGGNPPFRELLGRVRQTCLEAYAHQDLPFSTLVQALNVPRDPSRSPVVQVTFMLVGQTPPLRCASLAVERLEFDPGVAMFDLSLALREQPDGIDGFFEYNTDLFSPATIARMAGHWRTLLAALLADPDRPIGTAPLLTDTERQELLGAWAMGEAAPLPPMSLGQLFAAQAARTPDAPALVAGGDTLSYSQLATRVQSLAGLLQRHGVGPEQRVAVCLPRGLDAVVALLAILHVGGVYVPLDPAYPAARLQFMLDDARPGVVLTSSALASQLARPGDDAPTLIPLDAPLPPAPPVAPRALSADSAAYLIYTSGSTGQPKGVIGLQGATINRLRWMWQRYPFAADERCCQKTALSFVDSIAELLGPLLAGVPLVIIPDETVRDPARLVAALAEQRITRIVLVPSLLRTLLDTHPTLHQRLPRLRLWVASGETLPADLLERFRAALPAATLLNFYGSSEAAADATFYDTRQYDPPAPIPIGRPIANTQVLILDEHMQPTPIGVPGELYVGGAGLARGYFRQPALTAARFLPAPDFRCWMLDVGLGADPDSIPNPTSKIQNGSRLYKTGDLARWLPDGQIEFLGRIDGQIKLRGMRVEPDEIARTLEAHPAVAAAVVLLRADEGGPQRLVAYCAGPELPAPSALRQFLAERLPEHLIPSVFVPLERLPLTPSGKIDRRALPAPGTARPALETELVAPRDAVERALAEIWAQVLGVPEIGIHDNFFALGGDSILSIQVVARAQQAGLQLTPGLIFQQPTIAGLAAAAQPIAAAAAPVLESGPVPLTPIQHWFFAQEHAAPQHRSEARLFRPRAPLDWTLLVQAAQQLSQRHDVFRLRFTEAATGWQQIDSGAPELPCTRIDLAGTPPGERRAALEAAARAVRHSLDLTAGPLARVVLFDLGSAEPPRLLIVIHQLIVDDGSWRILLDDLEQIYRQLERGESPRLPAPPTTFQAWARLLHVASQTAALRDEADGWLERTAHQSTPLAEPPDGDTTDAVPHPIELALDAAETRALLEDVPPAYHTTTSDVLLTALARGFAAARGSRALRIDLQDHSRTASGGADLSRTVGWCVTLVPLLLDLGAADEPGAALRTIKEHIRQIPQQGIGYGLLRYLGPDRALADRLAAQPAAEISFAYRGQIDPLLTADRLFERATDLSESSVDPPARRYPLEIIGTIVNGQLRMTWIAHRGRYQLATIEALAAQCMAALRELIAHCRSAATSGYTPSDFPAARVSQADLDTLLGLIGRTGDETRR